MSDQVFPEPTVGAMIFNKSGQFLLVRSHKFKDQYVIPGGHIELGETMHEALRREIFEETGLTIQDIDYICMQEFIFDDVFWKKRHFIFHDFSCVTNDIDVTLNDEGQSFVWTTVEAASRLPVEPYSMHAIQAYQNRAHRAQ